MLEHNRSKYILTELSHHLPYSIFGVVGAIIMMGILTFVAKVSGAEHLLPEASKEIFHIFHPSHILLSAVATTAMFWKHDERSLLKAISIGFIGSVSICGISDIFIPFLGGKVLGYNMHIHVCLVQEPELIFPFAIVGVLAGLVVTKSFEHSTQYSHGIHVFLSSMASLLFLLSYGLVDWTHAVAKVFFVTIVAVMIPCCLSDIVFPLLCTHRYCTHGEETCCH